MSEPIEYFFNKIGFDFVEIKRIVSGKRYLGVMLNNGQIGVCATFGNSFDVNFVKNSNIDLNNFEHRVILNAYYNAKLNYQNPDFIMADMLDIIDFKKFKNIVMIGYFRPIVEKLDKYSIKLNVFDFRDTEISLPISEQKKYLSQSDATILTATSLFNNTFKDICENSSGDIFVLGPSALMSRYLFQFNNVKYIFGSVFTKFDDNVLDIIENNLGTRHFLKIGEKVVLVNV
ncbi:MAG: hypothetical protein JXR68_11705 [Bacteroidales bacterium]|nr:hypothetical protein [Bacteroidales bacterium]